MLKTSLSESRITANKIFKWILKYRKENIVHKKTFKKLTYVINKEINHTAVIPNYDLLLIR